MRIETHQLATIAVVLVSVSTTAEPAKAQRSDPKSLVAKVVEEAGGIDGLHRKRDVEYTYLYRNGATGKLDVSVERYVFDGEKSWARYEMHENLAPDAEGPILQGYDGETTWQTVDGEMTTDQEALKRADFLRKTNFYWFAMTFKLLDPGVTYSHEGRRKVGDVTYELVKVGFEPGVGDVSDTYLLYVNPETWRIDQFLFTVLDFGKEKPFLMKVEYERVDGILLPAKRRYTQSDWSGALPRKAKWTDEISVGIRFDNGFGDSLFAPPSP